MKIISIDGDEAMAEAGGLRRKANLSFLKGVRIGDYVLIHAGFAMEKIKDSEARKTLRAIMGVM